MSHARTVAQKQRLLDPQPIDIIRPENTSGQSVLNSSYAEIVENVFFKGMSLSDITKYLSIPESTARTRFRLAINNLKNKYNNDAGKFLSLMVISQLVFL